MWEGWDGGDQGVCDLFFPGTSGTPQPLENVDFCRELTKLWGTGNTRENISGMRKTVPTSWDEKQADACRIPQVTLLTKSDSELTTWG